MLMMIHVLLSYDNDSGEARFTLGGLKEVMKQTTYKVKVAYLEAIKEENTLHSTSLPTITDDVAMGEGPPLKHLTEFLKIKGQRATLHCIENIDVNLSVDFIVLFDLYLHYRCSYIPSQHTFTHWLEDLTR